jgi:hypothetical protein
MSIPPQPTRNWGRIALVVALALSLLGNALALGAALRFQSLRSELLGPAAGDALFPRATRRDLRAALAANSGRLLPQLHALVETRARIVATASERPFDRAAVATQMETFNAQAALLIAEVQGIFLDRLEAMAARP